MWAYRRRKTDGRGFTLIELLVVVVIIMILLGVMIPAMRPAMESRRTREAARGVNVFLSRARIRAMESGLSCGVLFERYEVGSSRTSLMR